MLDAAIVQQPTCRDAVHWASCPIIRRPEIGAALTSAQLDVLAKLSDGRAQKQVADELGISDSAVKARLVGARAALNANNTYQAIALAWRYGFLPHKHS